MKETVLVLGSGPIRIGQGIEFDYSCVHCVWSLQKMGYRAIIVNNNPETVSTDFDTGDGLYFEPVTIEDVLDVANREKPIGVVCQFGGQTAINLAQGLDAAGLKVLGTSPEAIAAAEDRGQFDQVLERLGLKRPKGRAVRSLAEAQAAAEEAGYPVLVRPSFVLGGRAMEIVYSPDHLNRFYGEAEAANPGQPVLVDQYIEGTEAELDVISDGEDTFVPGVMEHVERAGIHSGDSMAVYPPVSISPEVQAKMTASACRIAKALGVRGLMNIQFVLKGDEPYIIEVNPRASRTVPYLSKVTGIAMVELATRCMMGQSLKSLGFGSGLWIIDGGRKEAVNLYDPLVEGHIDPADKGTTEQNRVKFYAVKAPVFSFQKLGKVEPSLGPEMKSTGEVLGIDRTYESALYKALIASGIHFKGDGTVLITVKDSDKSAALEIAKAMQASGRTITATPGTAKFLQQQGLECAVVNKIQAGSPNILDLIMSGQVSLMVNTPSPSETSTSEAARIRRGCIETGVACITSIDTALALARAFGHFGSDGAIECLRLEEYFAPPVGV